MKTKRVSRIVLTKRQFFLLMIVPFFIGMAWTLVSLAHAEWNKKDDPLLFQSPSQQGWAPVEEKDLMPSISLSDDYAGSQ